jgi:hypothetical protein
VGVTPSPLLERALVLSCVVILWARAERQTSLDLTMRAKILAYLPCPEERGSSRPGFGLTLSASLRHTLLISPGRGAPELGVSSVLCL